MDLLAKYGPAAVDIIAPVFLLMLSFLASSFTRFVAAKTKNENLHSALTRIDTLVDVFVKAIDQTIVADLKDATKDGTFTAEEAAKAKSKALALVLEHLGPLNRIAADLGQQELDRVKAIIDAKIEARVADLRREQQKPATVLVLPEVSSEEVVQ